ncbi:Peptidase family S58 [Methylobrevis pamukkalensis]|uniref:Peptidase family S58 n=1 Tax=Methylobrevis pamukkalensis TaxID=1439726 RepID=A0A1E3H4E9_9HYPH|nr:Peptidase family S58 [Methylobrevis pamukkalensis]
MRRGPRNLITDVPGLAVGNATDPVARTGVTVILPDDPAIASVAVMGGAPGTRETDLLAPEQTVAAIDALVLAGGSAFGLDAAGGVMAVLVERGRGFPVGDLRVPIVPAAILFDLLNGGAKPWTRPGGPPPPYRDLGTAACLAAGTDFALGAVAPAPAPPPPAARAGSARPRSFWTAASPSAPSSRSTRSAGSGSTPTTTGRPPSRSARNSAGAAGPP